MACGSGVCATDLDPPAPGAAIVAHTRSARAEQRRASPRVFFLVELRELASFFTGRGDELIDLTTTNPGRGIFCSSAGAAPGGV
jgi:hypothetical protein